MTTTDDTEGRTMRKLELRQHPHRDGLAWIVDHGDYATILPTLPASRVTVALVDATYYGNANRWEGRELTTCGTCGRTWDDAIVSSVTPAPSARCPFEHEHGPTVCERCGDSHPLYDAHGWYCRPCRDADERRAETECPNCGHGSHDGRRCVGITDGYEACACSWPDPDNYAEVPPITVYRLTCGHAAQVPGEHGATTGRAWCVSCGESVAVAHVLPAGVAEAESVTCEHCGRALVTEGDRWIDPEATGDDAIWREACDEHDTFTAEHEPSQ